MVLGGDRHSGPAGASRPHGQHALNQDLGLAIAGRVPDVLTVRVSRNEVAAERRPTASIQGRVPLVVYRRDLCQCRYQARPIGSHLPATRCPAVSVQRRVSASMPLPIGAEARAGQSPNFQEIAYGEGVDYVSVSPHLRHEGLLDRLCTALDATIDSLVAQDRPVEVLEIGAGHGGFTQRLRDRGRASRSRR